MASVNFKKFKSATEAKAVLRHCDKEERLTTQNHTNSEIQKSRTSSNRQMKGNYKETCKRFDERIDFLDSLEGANKRKDRVIMFSLDIPVPKDMKPEHYDEWFLKVRKEVVKQYGCDNVLQMYVHKDEQHEYVNAETKQECVSRVHAHIPVIPVKDNKLNGKWFSSKTNIVKLNNAIQDMTERDYGIEFMDGSKKKSKNTVESLKRRSERLLEEQAIKTLQTEQESLKTQNKALQRDNSVLQAEINLKRAERLSEEQAIKTLQTECTNLKRTIELERKRKAQEDAEFKDFLQKKTGVAET
jgi:hypothetical protein